MNIFTPLWGAKNLALLPRALGRSLRWPKNAKAVENCRWTFLVDDEGKDARALAKEIIPSATVDILSAPILNEKDIDYGIIMMAALYGIMERCIAENMPMLMATPDFIFGEGTIDVFKDMGQYPGTCIAIPHPRVLPAILDEVTETPPTNQQLMSMAWRHPHASWYSSEVGLEQSGSHVGGISWRRLPQTNTVLVQHRMPSPFYVNFTQEDVEFFKISHHGRPPGFGIWDHVWPKLLLERQRLRLIGSSDAATMVEVTDEKMNVPPLHPVDAGEPDKYFRNELHCNIQRQFVSVFRGE